MLFCPAIQYYFHVFERVLSGVIIDHTELDLACDRSARAGEHKVKWFPH